MKDHRDGVFAHLDIQFDEMAATNTCFESGKGIFRIIGPESPVCTYQTKRLEIIEKGHVGMWAVRPGAVEGLPGRYHAPGGEKQDMSSESCYFLLL